MIVPINFAVVSQNNGTKLLSFLYLKDGLNTARKVNDK